MDLRQTVEWAKKLDLTKIPAKQNYKAKCYADMIIEKSTTVSSLTSRIESYMQDIQEYLGQLEKLGLTPEPKVQPTITDHKPEPEKTSPLLP